MLCDDLICRLGTAIMCMTLGPKHTVMSLSLELLRLPQRTCTSSKGFGPRRVCHPGSVCGHSLPSSYPEMTLHEVVLAFMCCGIAWPYIMMTWHGLTWWHGMAWHGVTQWHDLPWVVRMTWHDIRWHEHKRHAWHGQYWFAGHWIRRLHRQETWGEEHWPRWQLSKPAFGRPPGCGEVGEEFGQNPLAPWRQVGTGWNIRHPVLDLGWWGKWGNFRWSGAYLGVGDWTWGWRACWESFCFWAFWEL